MKFGNVLLGLLLVGIGVFLGNKYFSPKTIDIATEELENTPKNQEETSHRRAIDSVTYLTNSEQATIDLFEKSIIFFFSPNSQVQIIFQASL